MEVLYNYNLEEHKDFNKFYKKSVEEDKVKIMEKQKILKYIKLNPDTHQVRTRLIPKYLTNGIMPDMIPDYPVDITGFKPAVVKKTRRKYDKPKVNHYKTYDAWRCWDREWPDWAPEYQNIKVYLKPKYLINVNFLNLYI
jgi:hypothetical protein